MNNPELRKQTFIEVHQKQRTVLKWGTVGVGVVLLLWFVIGVKANNSLFVTKKQLTFHYYVQVVDENSNSNAVYTVPADVKSNSNTVACQSDYGCESGVNVIEIHWPDGGYTTFSSCSMENFNFADYVSCTATNGNHRPYGVKLTNKVVQ